MTGADELDSDIYSALVDVSDEREEWSVGDIAEDVDADVQETEARLHDLEDLGMVRWEEGVWRPVNRFVEEEEERSGAGSE
jgi:predicted transcriptional regulator